MTDKNQDLAEAIKIPPGGKDGDVEPSRTGTGVVKKKGKAVSSPAVPAAPPEVIIPPAPEPYAAPAFLVEEDFKFSSGGASAVYKKGDVIRSQHFKPGTVEDMKRQGGKLKEVK